MQPSNEHDTSLERALLRGALFEAGSAKSEDVVLRVAGDLLIATGVDDNKLRLKAPLKDVSVSDRIAAVQRRVSFPTGEVFVTHDNDGVDRLIGVSRSTSMVTWLEAASFKKFAVLVVLMVALIAGLYRYGLPLAVKTAVAVTPVPVIKAISEASLLGIERQLLKPSKLPEATRARLRAAFNHLVSNEPPRDERLKPTLRFHSSILGPNAFALPDGTIVVTDELVDLVDQDVVIGVIGHELGHVHHAHGLQLLYRSLGLVALVSLVTGDVGGILEEVALQGAGILSLSFARDHEREADAYSVEILRKSGFDPGAIVPFFEVISKFEKGDGSSNWLSTHPTSKERLENLKGLLDE